ncbi:hypothetical protein GCM10010971_21730 [Silvimonas amylolytica]|uniref:Uncharacterized protein n=1 Tax=Silvimonas amylolytica TaxID=449663 RepID=A0ABQ2PN07_9NEIS|nr:hypothetical protein GCM10010971_21730 [Silvimonas amylolytica]
MGPAPRVSKTTAPQGANIPNNINQASPPRIPGRKSSIRATQSPCHKARLQRRARVTSASQ